MHHRRSGFTLVELMIVVAILGILASIAVPMYNGYIRGAKRQEARSNLQTIRLLQEQYYADNKVYVEGDYGTGSQTLKANLPGFEPDAPAQLKYDYTVAFVGGNNQTFLAKAIPKWSTSADEELWIDQANTKVTKSGKTW